MRLSNDQKEDLDKLVMEFQREIAFNKDAGTSMAYLKVVEAINKTYGIEYDTHPENLRVYFENITKPCGGKEDNKHLGICGKLLMDRNGPWG